VRIPFIDSRIPELQSSIPLLGRKSRIEFPVVAAWINAGTLFGQRKYPVMIRQIPCSSQQGIGSQAIDIAAACAPHLPDDGRICG
jgi:hypothetical protein